MNNPLLQQHGSTRQQSEKSERTGAGRIYPGSLHVTSIPSNIATSCGMSQAKLSLQTSSCSFTRPCRANLALRGRCPRRIETPCIQYHSKIRHKMHRVCLAPSSPASPACLAKGEAILSPQTQVLSLRNSQTVTLHFHHKVLWFHHKARQKLLSMIKKF